MNNAGISPKNSSIRKRVAIVLLAFLCSFSLLPLGAVSLAHADAAPVLTDVLVERIESNVNFGGYRISFTSDKAGEFCWDLLWDGIPPNFNWIGSTPNPDDAVVVGTNTFEFYININFNQVWVDDEANLWFAVVDASGNLSEYQRYEFQALPNVNPPAKTLENIIATRTSADTWHLEFDSTGYNWLGGFAIFDTDGSYSLFDSIITNVDVIEPNQHYSFDNLPLRDATRFPNNVQPVAAAKSVQFYVGVQPYIGSRCYRNITIPAWTGENTSPTTTRNAGTNRIHTAVLTSQAAFASGSQTVIIAKASDFPDALAASTLAGALDCPILLSETGSVDAQVSAEIKRLGATKVYVVGGTSAVSDAVMNAYANLTGNAAERISGANRTATAIAIAGKVANLTGIQPTEVFIARSDNYVDALAGSSIAATQRIPILLTDTEALHAEVAAYLRATPSITTIHVLGGTAAVSAAALQTLRDINGISNVDRWYGEGRYDTASDIITRATALYGLTPQAIGIATGDAFPDALAGGAAIAHRGGILLLTPKTTLHAKTEALINTHKANALTIEVYGGTSAVSQSVQDAVNKLLS
jgi:putative cell wall-binding protein